MTWRSIQRRRWLDGGKIESVQAELLLVAQLVSGAQPAAVDPSQPAIVSGRVLDAGNGRPIAGAIVTPYGAAAATPGARVLTNGSGEFVIRGLQPGSLVLIARKGGYIDASHGQTRPSG